MGYGLWAFGSSSSSEEEEDSDNDDSQQQQQQLERKLKLFGENPKWEQITEIKGLTLFTHFLTSHQQSSLLQSIFQEGWFSDVTHNQAMRFGDLPAWAKELSTCIRELIQYSDYDPESMDTSTCNMDNKDCIFPSKLLHREPLFNQLIVNSYQPGEGICAHVDLMRFEDGIALVSLESSCVMHFSRVEEEFASNGKQAEAKIPVHLTPGSLLLISGEARYQWKHEINRKPGFQKWDGLEIDQKRRTSITLRKLCKSE
uniref:alkylated DNA repair protein ALKBH8 homolog n=1 Tax=Erigeron canadensis TaxID=72917 RepID=UPI001CB8F244|nr:alkylated DNA repair protein ALKBH8 homolog [Erigeron canadensis]